VRLVPPPKTMQVAAQQERRNILRGELVALCLLGISISHLRLSRQWDQIPKSLMNRRSIDAHTQSYSRIRGQSFAKNLSQVIDISREQERQTRAGDNQALQVDHKPAVLPQKRVQSEANTFAKHLPTSQD
jgi:hypothetical protein